jgi:hypothetical protein
MKKLMLTGLCFILSLVSTTIVCRAARGNEAFNINYLNNNLSVNIKNSSLDYVLEQVTKKTGVEFVLNDELFENNFYAEFASLPLAEAIQRLLNRFNYAMIYSSKGEIQKVIIIGKSTGSSRSFKLSPFSSDTAINQSIIRDIKNNKIPEGMVLTGLAKNASGNNVPAGMSFTKLSKKADGNNGTDGMTITKPSKKAVADNIPEGMGITELPKNASGNNIHDGMVIPPPPDKKNRKNLPVGFGSSIKKN